VTSPWHDGEIALQRTIGSDVALREIGPKIVRDYLTDQHRDFYPILPFAVLGTVDGEGAAWATIRAGRPGFLSAPDPSRLDLAIPPDPDDPAEAGLRDGQPAALLGIDLTTRRRNRLNGLVGTRTRTGFSLDVGQSFGNCPKYIRLRSPVQPAEPAIEAPAWLDGLDTDARRLIGDAETFFVASYAIGSDGKRQVDVSHRGGGPGFVRVGADGVLTIPDYAGNRFFNTLGNLAANPRAGLVFVDFATGDLLQLTGETEIILDSPEIATLPGAERLWRFRPQRILRRKAGLPLRWRLI
jgi:predicted pyridoxine 5'-phosphate oxidase superfamily flavin-nucleotide-binding protein